MSHVLKVCLAASSALIACNGPLGLESTRVPSPADASASAQDDGAPLPSVAALDAAPSSSDTGAHGGEAGAASAAATTVADAALDSAANVVATDGGRVPYRAIGVATGEDHTCALLDDHRVKCWGADNCGELGYGDGKAHGAPGTMGDNLPTVDLGTGRTALAIAASLYNTCALLDDGSIKCWGCAGLTGSLNAIGVDPGQMGDNLPALDFGGRKAVNFGMGRGVGCASMDDDSVWCWGGATGPGGANTPWQSTGLPAKRVKMFSPENQWVVALYDDGTLLSPQPPPNGAPNGASPFMLTSDRNIVAVTGGWGDATCVLFDDATTACLVPGFGQTNGPANVVAIGAQQAVGTTGLCVALTDGDVQCNGEQCAPPYQCSSEGSFTFGSSAVALTVNGSLLACALLENGNIKCWDDNSDTGPPRLALGDEFDFTTQPDGGIVYGPWHAVDLGTH